MWFVMSFFKPQMGGAVSGPDRTAPIIGVEADELTGAVRTVLPTPLQLTSMSVDQMTIRADTAN
jgi:hypothetical protein